MANLDTVPTPATAQTLDAWYPRAGSNAVGSLSIINSAGLPYAGNMLEVDAASGSGSFTGNFIRCTNAGTAYFRVNSAGTIVAGPYQQRLIFGAGVPIFPAPGGSLFLRYDGEAGARMYVNQASSGSGSTWAAIPGV